MAAFIRGKKFKMNELKRERSAAPNSFWREMNQSVQWSKVTITCKVTNISSWTNPHSLSIRVFHITFQLKIPLTKYKNFRFALLILFNTQKKKMKYQLPKIRIACRLQQPEHMGIANKCWNLLIEKSFNLSESLNDTFFVCACIFRYWKRIH